MTTETIRLSSSQTDDFKVVMSISVSDLQEIERAASGSATFIKLSRFRELVSRSIKGAAADSLERVVLTVAGASRRERQPVTEIVERLERGLKLAKWTDGELDAWRERKGVLAKLLMSKAVSAATKAWDVSYDYVEVLSDARLYTDVRPVFDSERETVVGASVVQTLRLDYWVQGSGYRCLTVRLDAADLEKLKARVDEALRKADAVRQLLETKAGIEVITLGSEK